MLLRVLGPLDVVDDAGVERAVTAAHQRRVLARLAIASPHSVSVGTLMDAVWGETSPDTAVAALQNYVSALRKLLGPAVIVSDGGGYRLNSDRVEVDATVFEELIATAHKEYDERRPGSALTRLDQALALWRGEPLDDAGDTETLAAAERFRELRLSAHEQRALCHLDLERPDVVASELPSLIARHPLRERLVELLMTALYRTGRQAEALAAYQDLRSTLADELGLDPSPALQQLEQDVLNQASRLLPTAAVLDVRSTAHVPSATDELIGRDDALDELASVFGGIRLLSIVGTGGIGKTTFATALATATASRFDRVGFIRLETATTPEAALSRMADDLGVPSTTTTEVPPALTELLGTGTWLLVLDNVEQVTGVARHLSHLLETCPGLTLVVTSRVALNVRGEHVHHLPPLALPDAIRLITDRARAADAAVHFDASDDEHLATICTALDGLPLALELAAPRLTALSPAALATRLRHSVLTLPGGTDRPDRHRTLRDTVDWSYRLVSMPARGLLRTLAAFRDGATLDALEHVVGADAAAELTELRAAGLLNVDRGGTRYRLLETIREFGLAALMDEDEEFAVRAAHADYFAELAGSYPSLFPAIVNPGGADATDRPPLDPEVANLEAALGWLWERDRARALTVGLPLSTLYTQSGRIDERRRLMARLLTLADDVRTELGLGYLEAIGRFTTGVGLVIKEVDDLFRRAVDFGDDRVTADISQYLSGMWCAEYDLARAREVIDIGLAAATRTGDLLLLGRTYGCSFGIALTEGDFELAMHDALGYRDNAVRYADATEQASGYACVAQVVLAGAGDTDRAIELVDEAERILRDAGVRHNLLEMWNAEARGWIAVVRGDARAAAAAYREALRLRVEMSTEGFVVDSIAGVATALVLDDRYDEAATFFDAVDDLSEINPAWRATSYLVSWHARYADIARARTRQRTVSWIRHYDLRQVMILAMAACDEIIDAGSETTLSSVKLT